MTAPAYRADGRDCSREAFYALACDPMRSIVVEACAGAGKTWMLVSRIVRALLAGAQPHEILAITFTRKAAGEVRQRLQQWLGEFALSDRLTRVDVLVERGLDRVQAEALEPTLAQLHAKVLACGRGVEIQTFHAWFARLMRSAPIEVLERLGLQPSMDLLEDVAELKPALLRRLYLRLLELPDRLTDYEALVTQHGRSRIAQWLEAALDKRVEIELADAAGTLEPSVAPAAQLWRSCRGLQSPVERLRTDTALRAQLEQAGLVLGRAGGAAAAQAATGLRQALEGPDPSAAFETAWRALFTAAGAPRKLGEQAELHRAWEALRTLSSMIDQHQAHEDHLRMARLARVVFDCWRDLKREQGLADMPDLERCAWMLLADPVLSGWMAERLDTLVRHLLIDEFQDTSPLQWHALTAWLAGYAGAGGGASGQRPPSVFIVGDPKQSIYRFRRAEPKVFEAARDFIVQTFDGVVLECDHTRRNASAVVQALNSVFTQASAEMAFTGFRPHSTERAALPAGAVRRLPDLARPASAARRTQDASSTWRDSLAVPRVEPEQKLRSVEMRHVASAVAQLLAQPDMEPGQIMVLARKRSVLAQAAEALRELQIPCVAPEQLRVTDMPEARDLIALLDALASNGHDLALAQALKSPLFGLDDAMLLELSGRAAVHDRPWWDALMAWRDAPALVARAQALLARWAEAARWLPPHDLLDRIVAEGQALERFAAAAPPARRILASQALFALLNQVLALDGARYATPYGLVRALLRRAPLTKAVANAQAVQLLTVHAAKGLEARVVFLLDSDPEARVDTGPTVLVDWPVHSQRPNRVAFVAQANRCAPSLQDLDAVEREAAQREELNALYVAMTRAEDLLVVSRTQPHRAAQARSWWARLGAATPLAWEPALPQAAAERADERTTTRIALLPSLVHVPARAETVAIADEPAARLGRAVHRVLEWAASAGSSHNLTSLAAAAAREQGLAPSLRSQVQSVASSILSAPRLASLFDDRQLQWAGNEVALAHGGDWLRVDRLVQLAPSASTPQATWWVLDYKLTHRPEQIDAYREQLRLYRDLVQRLAPGEPVRAAFITGDARLIELID